MNEARGRGFLHGVGRSESWAPLISGLVRLIGGCTVYRPGRPRISLRPLSSPSVPHHLYRGPKSRGRNFKISPCTHRRLCTRPQNGGPNRETNEARGGGFLHGAGRSESWAPHDIRYVVPTGPQHFPRTAFLTVGTASSLSRGPKSGGRNLKAPPAPIAGSALAHRTAGPTGKRRRRGGEGSCTGPVEVNRGPLMTSGLVRLIGPLYGVPTGRHRISHALLLTVGTASSLSRGRNLKAPPNPSHILCTPPIEWPAHNGNPMR